jgi:hypothetical protein
VSQSTPFALPADVARADGDVLVYSEGLRRGVERTSKPGPMPVINVPKLHTL